MTCQLPFSVRIVYVVSHPIQYQSPLFRRLSQSPLLEFSALFGCDYGISNRLDPGFGREVNFGVDLLGGFKSTMITQSGEPAVDRFLALKLGEKGRVAVSAANVVVLHGWRTMMMWEAANFCRRRNIPYLVRAEAPLLGAQQQRPKLKQFLWRSLIGWYLKGSYGVLSLGSANRRFYETFNVPANRIFKVPYFVDNDAVRTSAQAGRRARTEVRRSIGLQADAFVVVAVGKLLPRKRPLDLIHALASLPERVHLVWIGAGEMEESFFREARERQLQHRVRVTGFQPSESVWKLMGAADAFAHPAENEPWGLVVNEALAAGLPLLVSADTGAAEDLIRSPEVGEILPVGDVAAWARAISTRLVLSGASDSFCGVRTKLLEDYSIKAAADGIISASLQALADHRTGV